MFLPSSIPIKYQKQKFLCLSLYNFQLLFPSYGTEMFPYKKLLKQIMNKQKL